MQRRCLDIMEHFWEYLGAALIMCSGPLFQGYPVVIGHSRHVKGRKTGTLGFYNNDWELAV